MKLLGQEKKQTGQEITNHVQEIKYTWPGNKKRFEEIKYTWLGGAFLVWKAGGPKFATVSRFEGRRPNICDSFSF